MSNIAPDQILPGSEGQVVTVVGGVATWSNPTGLGAPAVSSATATSDGQTSFTVTPAYLDAVQVIDVEGSGFPSHRFTANDGAIVTLTDGSGILTGDILSVISWGDSFSSWPLPFSLATTPTGQKSSGYIEFQITVPADAYSASRKITVAAQNSDGTGAKAASVDFSPGNLAITWHKPDTSYQTYNYGDVSGTWMAPGDHTIRIAAVGNEFQFTVDSNLRLQNGGDGTYWPSNPSYIVAPGFALIAAPVVVG